MHLTDQEVLKAFHEKQKVILVDVLKKNPLGLSLDGLMIESKLSENTVLRLTTELCIKNNNGVFTHL